MCLLPCFGQPFQRKPERRVVQCQGELIQRAPGRFAEFSGGEDARAAAEGNLHLDADSVNLTTPVLQHNNKFRRKLAQFCGKGGIGDRNTENARLQPQYLAGLSKTWGGNIGKMTLQGRQCLCLDQ